MRFHFQMHRSADGMPEDIDAPAPRKKRCGVDLLMPIDRTRASSGRTRLSTALLLIGLSNLCLLIPNLLIDLLEQVLAYDVLKLLFVQKLCGDFFVLIHAVDK